MQNSIINKSFLQELGKNKHFLRKLRIELCVLVAQSSPTLCDPMDCSLLGSSVHGPVRQEYWSGLPFHSPGDFPNPGFETGSPALQVDSLPSEPPGKPRIEENFLNLTKGRYKIIIIIIIIIYNLNHI